MGKTSQKKSLPPYKKISESIKYIQRLIDLKRLLLILGFLGAVFSVVEFVVIKPYKNENEELKKSLTNANTEKQVILGDLAELEKSFNNVVSKSTGPVLQKPVDGSSIIGEQVKFVWKHDTEETSQSYILGIRKIDKFSNNKIKKYNISNNNPKEKMELYFPLQKIFSNQTFSGEYLWQIQPGSIVKHEEKEFEVIQGQKSHFNFFEIYPSVEDRINKTRKLLVGTSPTILSGLFCFYNHEAEIEGFDIKLINWIADELITRKK